MIAANSHDEAWRSDGIQLICSLVLCRTERLRSMSCPFVLVPDVSDVVYNSLGCQHASAPALESFLARWFLKPVDRVVEEATGAPEVAAAAVVWQ